MFETKKQFLEFLGDQQKFSMKLNLNRIKRACELLDGPQLQLKTIHVAGTNGKGSTCNYLTQLLKASGYKVGLYISPYIITFNERIQINGEYISDEDLIATANEILPIIKQVESELQDDLTEFEVITLLSFVYFVKQKVDYAVFEVGLGGRYDATNVISPIVGGITNISFDHMGVLGDTLEKIAYEKIGIAKSGMSLYTTEVNKQVLEVFENIQKTIDYELIQIKTDVAEDIIQYEDHMSFYYLPYKHRFDLPMLGAHQVRNACLALHMYDAIMDMEQVEVNMSVVKQGLTQSRWGGRLEIVSRHPFILIDGSHNQDGVLKLVEAMRYYVTKGYHITTVFAALKDKETTEMLQLLQSISNELILTSFDYYRANTAEGLYLQTNKVGVSMNEDYEMVLNQGIQKLKEKEILLITGSLYFVAEVKKYLRNRNLDVVKE